jgi:hypothetical protein
MPESRVEIKDRLLLELGFVFYGPRRALFDDSNPNPSSTKMALAQSQYRQELKEWTRQFRQFITINNSEVTHFWDIVMEPCSTISNLLMTPASIEDKRDRFNATVSQILVALRSIPADDPDVMVPPKSAFLAYRRLHAIVATASTRIHLLDPYLDAKTFLLYLPDVPHGVEIKVVTDETIMVQSPKRSNYKKSIHQRDRIVATSELLANDRPDDFHFLMVPSIHDRQVRADDKVFQLGGSMVHASLKDYYSITETDNNPILHATLDSIITSATPWYQPGMPRHRRWCPTCSLVSDVKASGECQACNTPL